MLVVGNVYKDEAIALARMTEEIIPASPIPGPRPVDLSLKLPESTSTCLRIRSFDNLGLVQAPIMSGHPLSPTPMSPTLL